MSRSFLLPITHAWQAQKLVILCPLLYLRSPGYNVLPASEREPERAIGPPERGSQILAYPVNFLLYQIANDGH
jgi:hypothetical protein